MSALVCAVNRDLRTGHPLGAGSPLTPQSSPGVTPTDHWTKQFGGLSFTPQAPITTTWVLTQPRIPASCLSATRNCAAPLRQRTSTSSPGICHPHSKLCPRSNNVNNTSDPMISPPIPATSPAGADLHRTSSRRRGLSYFRAFSHSRSGNTSPSEPSRSPRHYFQRSLSHNSDSRSHQSSLATRRRSNSRPDEPTSPLGGRGGVSASSQDNLHSPTSPAASRLAPNPAVAQPSRNTTTTDSGEESMARQRNSTLRRHTTAGHLQTSTSATEASEPAARPANPRTQTVRTPGANTDSESKPQLPAIRLHSHQEARNGRPSLTFSPISRTLPNENATIRVGRYSEREGVPSANPSTPSDAPVGFKSKVVSRKHCEFSFVDSQWQIKDVASSSGTFLNHIRLSQPNTESRLFPIKDGDIVQLGIDFRGGEEMIFRCVKIRVECNRSWQKKPNTFKCGFLSQTYVSAY